MGNSSKKTAWGQWWKITSNKDIWLIVGENKERKIFLQIIHSWTQRKFGEGVWYVQHWTKRHDLCGTWVEGMKRELIESKRLDCGIKIDLNEKYRNSKNLKKNCSSITVYIEREQNCGIKNIPVYERQICKIFPECRSHIQVEGKNTKQKKTISTKDKYRWPTCK